MHTSVTVSESISGAGQSCVRGMPVSAIFCTVQVLQEPKEKNLSTLQNS